MACLSQYPEAEASVFADKLWFEAEQFKVVSICYKSIIHGSNCHTVCRDYRNGCRHDGLRRDLYMCWRVLTTGDMEFDGFEDAFSDPIILDEEVLQSLIAVEAKYKSDSLVDSQNQSTFTTGHRRPPVSHELPARKRPKLNDKPQGRKRLCLREEDTPDIIVNDRGEYSLTDSKLLIVSSQAGTVITPRNCASFTKYQ
jgi:hypothetical protein